MHSMPDTGFTGIGRFLLVSGISSPGAGRSPAIPSDFFLIQINKNLPIGRYRTVSRFPLIIFERYRYDIPPL
jgi:hypothetical protein